MPKPQQSSAPARDIALQQLQKLESTPSTPDFDADDSWRIESSRDHRLVTEYVAGITRWRRWLDFIVASFYKGDFERMEPALVHILRLGTYDLLKLRTPSHAAINEAVNLAKRRVRPGAGGLVNGILRSIDRSRDSLPEPSGDAVTQAGIQYSHPDWLVHRWIHRYGEEANGLMAWNNERPVYSIRVNTLKTTREDFIRKMDDAGIEWEPGRYLGDFFRVPKLQPIVRGGFLKDGWCAVQDESAGLIVRLLDPQPGDSVLDLCAAPGGKTLYAAARMEGGGSLLANDAQAGRLDRLNRVKSSYKADWVETKVWDAKTLDKSVIANKTLLDAPCSGLGVLSKRADLRWKRKPEDIPNVARIQKELLDAAARYVEPGGVLVYSTCTIEPEENEEQLDRFLEAHPEFQIDDAHQWLPDEVVTDRGYLSTFPPDHRMDGVFGAKMAKSR